MAPHKIHIIGVPMDLGAGRRGVDMGPSAIRIAGVSRQLAALGYLSGHPGPEAVRVLRDYLDWEEHPALRRRAVAIMRRMESKLG